MDNKKIPTSVGTIVIVIIAITAGVLVWKYEKQQERDVSSSDLKIQGNKESEKDVFNNFKISDFDTWKDYRNEAIGVKIKYPKELYIDESDKEVTFDYLSPNDPVQKNEGSLLLHLSISKEQKTIKQYIEKYKLNALQNFKQTQVQLNGSHAEQITYKDAFAGGEIYTTLIQKENNLIIINYAGDNKLEDTFNKMLSTVTVNKTEKVSFCGKTYVSDQMIINGIDIIKTLATISRTNDSVCKNLESGNFQESGVGLAKKTGGDNLYLISIFHRGNSNEENDPFNQSPNIFKFDLNANKVLYQSQFDGSFNILGNIK